MASYWKYAGLTVLIILATSLALYEIVRAAKPATQPSIQSPDPPNTTSQIDNATKSEGPYKMESPSEPVLALKPEPSRSTNLQPVSVAFED